MAKTEFWAEIRNFGPTKNSLLNGHHAATGKCCANKKVPFSQRYIDILAKFWCFFCLEKTDFGQETTTINISTIITLIILTTSPTSITVITLTITVERQLAS